MAANHPPLRMNRTDQPTISDSLAAAMARSASTRIEAADLDLAGAVVITEAATGSYAVTAAAAAAAGGEVHALAGDTSFGSAADAMADVSLIAAKIGVDPTAIHFTATPKELPLERSTLVTNSGIVRPIDSAFISRLPESAVIALMYEAWEARNSDIDFAAAAARGIEVIGVNEHHPACAAFEFVGDLALYGMRLQQWPVRSSRVLLFSDNQFADPILRALTAGGATVVVANTAAPSGPEADVVIVAVTPLAARSGLIEPTELSRAIVGSGAYGCVQLWGDLDRELLQRAGVAVTPTTEPPEGHQGIPMSAAGFEAVVRLQIGGMGAALHRSVASDSFLFGLAQRIAPVQRGTR